MTAQIFEQSTAQADIALAELTKGSAGWSALPLAGRRELLQALSASVAAHAQEWVSVAAGYKGLDAKSSLLGEEWTSGPYAVLTALAALTESLRALEAGRSPIDGVELGSAPGGRVTVKALPHNVFDKLLLNGFSADVWMQPGVGAAQARSEAGLGQRHPTEGGGVGVVLGAGNITSIPVLDVLYELIAHNRVSVLKLNPVTSPILAVFQRACAPMIEAGFLRIVTGGADVGQFLVNHPSVTHVHITGSAASHDAIVFGAGIDGQARKAAVRLGAAEPLLAKEISSELGGVSPTIVVPGKWSKADLRYQAEHVATQRLHNGGYNCIAGQAVILSSDWPQRSAFLAELRSALSKAPRRATYYPGSDARVAAARASYPGAEMLDNGALLVTGVPLAPGETALNTEYFAPVLVVTELPGTGLGFLRAAVAAANDDFVGTLGVNVIAHPRTLRAAGAAFDQALAELRYGCVAVNAWTGFGFLTARATWGAFPGHTPADVQSGIGMVHNAFLLDKAERTVVRGPFRPSHRSWAAGEFTLSPKPPWFVTNRTQATTGRRLTRFAAKPGWAKLPGIFASALRG
jgi:aldehyde dehydrogenase (NAD(P)+)